MRKSAARLLIIGILSSAVFATGCTQMPTEKQSVSDMRPQISFKAESERAKDAQILVDDLNMGTVSEFLDGDSAIRVLPGIHIITVSASNSILLSEKVYLGDGVSRSFIVK